MTCRGLVTIGLPSRNISFFLLRKFVEKPLLILSAHSPSCIYLCYLLYCKRSLLICDCSLRILCHFRWAFFFPALFPLVVFFCFPALFPRVVLWPPLQKKKNKYLNHLIKASWRSGAAPPSLAPPSPPPPPPPLSINLLYFSLSLCHVSLSSLSLSHKRNTPAGGIPDQEPQRQGNSQATPPLSVL